MKNWTLATMAMLATLVATPVFADWETTSWGMSPDETLAALEGARSHDFTAEEIYLVGDVGYAPRVKLAHDFDGVAGEISLLFDDAETLRFVLFNPADVGDCTALADAVVARHGEAEVLEMGPFTMSDWAADGNAMTLTASEQSGVCNLSYSEG